MFFFFLIMGAYQKDQKKKTFFFRFFFLTSFWQKWLPKTTEIYFLFVKWNFRRNYYYFIFHDIHIKISPRKTQNNTLLEIIDRILPVGGAGHRSNGISGRSLRGAAKNRRYYDEAFAKR